MKKKKSPEHPIAKAIDAVLVQGHTPRIHVDARRSDVTVPDHVRERWQARLVIDLDPSWPLNLELSETGLAVNLAFQGVQARCEFGWSAIYVVLDRATGRGTVIEAQLPPHELPAELTYTAPSETPRAQAHTRPTLVSAERPVSAALLPAVEPNKPKRRPATKPQSKREPVREAPPPGGATVDAKQTTDEAAKERRARFRVITGGG